MTQARPILHLIDGSGYIFRAYYAVRPLSTRAGVPTNAVLGFARMLLKLLRERTPHHLGIAFDTSKKNFRHAIYAQYKANREAPPEDLVPQFELIFDLVRAMDIPLLVKEGFEADDVLASLSRQAVDHGYDVVVVSADKDLMQLVDAHVGMYDPMRDKVYNDAAVFEKFGVPPRQIADLLALAGDTSDNIPGVPRVGPKSAAKMVAEFGDVEAIIAGLGRKAKRKAVEEAVVQHAEQARLSKRLTVLDAQAPIALEVEGLRYTRPDLEKLGPFLQRVEAFSLMRDFGLQPPDDFGPQPDPGESVSPGYDAGSNHDAGSSTGTGAAPGHAGAKTSTAALQTQSPPLPQASAGIDRLAYQTISTAEQLAHTLQHLERADRFCIDLETTSLDAARADIVGVALAAPGMQPVYVPVAHRYLGAPKQLARAFVLEQLRPLLVDASHKKVGQHIKYDAVVLARAGIKLQGIAHDSLMAAYVLDPARPSFSLDALAREFLGHQNMTYNEVTGTGKNRLGFDEVDIQTATRYAAEDADVALKLCDLLIPRLKQADLWHVYHDIEMPLVAVLADMENSGVQVDAAHLQGLSKEFNRRLIDIENEAFAIIGSPINLSSPKQLAYLFFEKLGYQPVKKTKTGYSTDSEVLEVLARSHDLPRIILNHRTLSKLRSTYVDALPKMINPETGRLHTNFNQSGTATGRLSSSDPNLQNIPIRSDDGKRIRGAFTAPPGCEIISADYSQVELRILAHLSQDASFMAAFARGEDIHARTAREIFSHIVAPAAELRRRAKAINFGIAYGLSEFGLSKQLQISRAEAHAYLLAHSARYPRIREYMDRTIETGRERGYVSTVTGRRRYLPNLRSKNGNLRQSAERIAMNTPVQGCAADLIKLAMLQVHKALQTQGLRARLVLQVHDELVVESPIEERYAVTSLLKQHMAQVMQLRVPLEVAVGHGANWAEAH